MVKYRADLHTAIQLKMRISCAMLGSLYQLWLQQESIIAEQVRVMKTDVQTQMQMAEVKHGR